MNMAGCPAEAGGHLWNKRTACIFLENFWKVYAVLMSWIQGCQLNSGKMLTCSKCSCLGERKMVSYLNADGDMGDRLDPCERGLVLPESDGRSP